jgi:hypothetical protein
VAFLDVLVENQFGRPATSVYDKEAAEPYILSFESDHPRNKFRNIIQGALFRASRYSSTIDAFDEECHALEITLLYNG